MTTALGDLTLEDAAKQAAGNWRQFGCFCWHRESELEDAENWAICYSNREFEATLENIRNVAWRLKNAHALTDGWEIELYSWLSENNPRAIENLDDQGGCPSEGELETSIESLGFKRKS
jgi:hypothetical protein